MFVIAGAIAFGIARAIGNEAEGLWMMIAGPLLVGLDVGYRRARKTTLFGARGGTFILLPVWCWGVFWSGLGAYYVWR